MDCALSLYPLPDLVVIGDPSKPFETNHQGCSVVNVVREKLQYYFECTILYTILKMRSNHFILFFVVSQGSFPKSKFTFKVYVPSSKLMEDSQIPDD